MSESLSSHSPALKDTMTKSHEVVTPFNRFMQSVGKHNNNGASTPLAKQKSAKFTEYGD